MKKSCLWVGFVLSIFLSSAIMADNDQIQFFLEEVETPESVETKVTNYNQVLSRLEASAIRFQNDDDYNEDGDTDDEEYDDDYDGGLDEGCLLYTSPSPRDKRQSRMPSSA